MVTPTIAYINFFPKSLRILDTEGKIIIICFFYNILHNNKRTITNVRTEWWRKFYLQLVKRHIGDLYFRCTVTITWCYTPISPRECSVHCRTVSDRWRTPDSRTEPSSSAVSAAAIRVNRTLTISRRSRVHMQRSYAGREARTDSHET